MKLAAVVIAATIAGTSLASAQSIEFRTGPRHDGVYVDRDRDWRDSRAYYRDRDRGDTVVIKKQRRYSRDYDRDYDHPRPGVTFRTW
jgi:Ni/Co efflux regulator RcnB